MFNQGFIKFEDHVHTHEKSSLFILLFDQCVDIGERKTYK